MKPGEARSTWSLPGAWSVLRAGCRCALVVALVAGCRSARPTSELLANPFRSTRSAAIAERYTVQCPDVLKITFDQHPELSGAFPVGVDGRIDLEALGRPRVEGQCVGAVAQQLADLAAVPRGTVEVHVGEYYGQSVYLFGAVTGLQRAVPYQGQETVVDLLRRTGGITQGAAPREVYVVRSHLADYGRPEIFHVDLEAIVVEHDERTNLRIEPYDQVHVGDTRRAQWERYVPPWLRPLYGWLCGWLPGQGSAAGGRRSEVGGQ
jgi:protein involved in polysaccharide export with SLBB domain